MWPGLNLLRSLGSTHDRSPIPRQSAYREIAKFSPPDLWPHKAPDGRKKWLAGIGLRRIMRPCYMKTYCSGKREGVPSLEHGQRGTLDTFRGTQKTQGLLRGELSKNEIVIKPSNNKKDCCWGIICVVLEIRRRIVGKSED